MKTILSAALALTTAVAVATSAAAAATTYTDLAAWQAAAGAYTETTHYAAENTDVTALTLSDGTTLAFDHTLEATSIGDDWGTWSGGYTAQVLIDPNLAATSLTITPGPSGGFGFFIEPDAFATETFVLTLSDGSTKSAAYAGDAGAGFLGYVGSDVTSVSIVDSAGDDFAIGDIYTKGVSAAPEPLTWSLMLVGVGAIGAALRTRRSRPAIAAFGSMR